MKLKCPLCMGISFASEEILLHSLLSFASMNIACPLCMEVLGGFDKFTIHLCSHVFNLKSSSTVHLIQDASTKSLNEILENIHIDGLAESSESNFRMPTQMVHNADGNVLKNSNWSVPSMPYSNFESTTNESEKLLKNMPVLHTNPNAPASREDHSNESGDPSPFLQVTPGTCPQVLQKPCEPQLALQVSSDSNQLLGSSSPFCSVADPALPVVDIFKNFDFLCNVDESTTDFNPVEDPFADLKQSQTQIFVPTFTPTAFKVDEDSDPGGVDVNTKNRLCDICSISFPDVNILSLHKELVHEKTGKGQTSKPKFQCELCKRKFKLKASLLAHQQVAHTVENGAGMLDANQNEDNSQFHCSMCSKIFKKENYLVQHMKTHEEKQWTCDECGKMFATKHFLQNHKRLHTGEMPYICSICNKQFTFQQSYHRHIAYHNSEKPHRCKECGKSFKELSTLYNHQRIHTGEKPFSCDVCGKTIGTSRNDVTAVCLHLVDFLYKLRVLIFINYYANFNDKRSMTTASPFRPKKLKIGS